MLKCSRETALLNDIMCVNILIVQIKMLTKLLYALKKHLFT